MLLIAARKGGVKCSSACPFYTDTGQVAGVRGIPLKTHCRMTMNPWMVDCDIYNPTHLEKVEVTEEQWKNMLKAIGKRATKVIKRIPEKHKEIHPVGWTWRKDPKGKWNASKSSNTKH